MKQLKGLLQLWLTFLVWERSEAAFASINSSVPKLTINLSNYSDSTKFYKSYIPIRSTTISVQNIPKNIAFIIVQVHSFQENATLSHKSFNFPLQFRISEVSGRNIGLVYLSNATEKANFSLKFPASKSGKALLIITLYEKNAPLPGGCNLTFDTEIAPYLKITTTDELIFVDSQAASSNRITCDANKITMDLYQLYLPINYDNYNKTVYEQEFFDSILEMISVNDIKDNARRISNPNGVFRYRRAFNSYRGIGEVFVVVATFAGVSSAYVPAVTYGCEHYEHFESCVGSPVSGTEWKIGFSMFLIIGSIVCVFGYNLVDLIFHSFCKRSSSKFFNYVFWIPKLLLFVLTEILIFSTIFFFGIGDTTVFNNSTIFWILFVGFLFISIEIFALCQTFWTVFAFASFGGFLIVLSLDYFFGNGILGFIPVTMERRFLVDGFNNAVISPPIGNIEWILLLTWMLLSIFGASVQLKLNDRKYQGMEYQSLLSSGIRTNYHSIGN